jgi:hypothetical protein
MRRQAPFFGILAVTLALVLFWATTNEAAFAADRPATHNMLLIGEKTVYLSHLPMFQDPRDLKAEPPRIMPHRYQAILEVTFNNQATYVKDRHGPRPPKLYTLGPAEQFVLSELTPTDPQRKPVRSSFKAKICRGHLEKPDPDGEGAILRNVQVNVKRVVHFREFDPKAKRPARLEYLLFGKRGELFLAHLIVAPPDFDQLLSVKVTGHEFTDEELAKGVQVVFPGTTDTPAGRLKAKQQGTGEMTSGSPPTAKKVQIEVGGELYFEEGELRVPPDFDTTPEEDRAGFP